MKIPVLMMALCCTAGQLVAQQQTPMIQPYQEVALSAVKPRGWLQQQLDIMRRGTTGHLDEVHAKIARDNGWLGGQGDGWEETPYWLDGAVPLAYLLDDPALKTKVLKYINWTLDNQRPSGYFGPVTKAEREKNAKITPGNCGDGEDWWPKMVMLKVLRQYYSATGDTRVITFMTSFFKYQMQAIDGCPIGRWTEWGTARGIENIMLAQWLYGITKDKDLLALAERIETQSFPWATWLGNRDWVMNAAANQTEQHWMSRHAVNVGMGLKAPAIHYQRTANPQYLNAQKTGWSDLMLLHGLPMGIFSGDEDLHGNDPTQGVELCAIVESMYSLEEIIAITGDIRYMDALERMTFNALPTQTTDDYNAKQYFQIANQVQISRGVFDFSLPFDREMTNVLGMRSGYTCCLANMHQGWTKFAHHLWYATPNGGFAALEYAPNEFKTKAGTEDVTIAEITNYPFDDVIDFVITTKKEVSFPLLLRIPSWCREASILLNGMPLRKEKGGQVVTVERTWKNKDKLTLQLPMEVQISTWAKNSKAVERGPLVYALKVGERWEKETDPVEGDYFSVYPTQGWNYGLLEEAIRNPGAMKVSVSPLPNPFVWNQKSAPITITSAARKIPGWKAIDGVAHQPVTERFGIYKGKTSPEVENITLIPYGFTKVRIVAFPIVK
jgi:uncharacterized protein